MKLTVVGIDMKCTKTYLCRNVQCQHFTLVTGLLRKCNKYGNFTAIIHLLIQQD